MTPNNPTMTHQPLTHHVTDPPNPPKPTEPDKDSNRKMYKGLKMFSNNFPNLREALLKFMQARPELLRNSSFCVLPKSGKWAENPYFSKKTSEIC